jgi:hypothetical protein
MKRSFTSLLQPALGGVLVAIAVTQLLRSGRAPRGLPSGFSFGAGSRHVPLLGDAIDALTDPFEALEARVERFGNATALRWWTMPAVVLSGEKALHRFADAAYVDRSTPLQSSWLARTVSQHHAAPAAAGYSRPGRRHGIEKVRGGRRTGSRFSSELQRARRVHEVIGASTLSFSRRPSDSTTRM